MLSFQEKISRKKLKPGSGRNPFKLSRLQPQRIASQVLPPLGVLSIFIGFWYVVANVILRPDIRFVMPSPDEVLFDGFLVWRNSMEKILEGLYETSKVALLGFGISIGLGVIAAVLMSRARWMERTLFPYAVALQAVPIVAVVPLIGLWWGFGFSSKVVVAIIISIFPIITNALFGLRSVEKNMHDLFTLHSSSSLTRFYKLQMPAAVPSLFAGLRISAALAVTGTVVGEFFYRAGQSKGLGRLIAEEFKAQAGQGPEQYTAIIVTCALGIALFSVVSSTEKFFTRHLTEGAIKK